MENSFYKISIMSSETICETSLIKVLYSLTGKYRSLRVSNYFYRYHFQNDIPDWMYLKFEKIIQPLTHLGQVMHISTSKLAIIGPDNGLLLGRHPAIIWTNDRMLLNKIWGTSFSEIVSEIDAFSFKKMHLKMTSGKRRPSCLVLNVLNESSWKSVMIAAVDGLAPTG